MRSPPAATISPTCTHHLPASPHTAVLHGMPETEPQTLGFGFLTQTPPPPRNLRTHHPTTITALYEPPHHLPPSPLTSISNGVPKTEPHKLGFGLLAQIPPPVHFFLP